MDDGAVPLEFAVEELAQEVDGGRGDFDAEGGCTTRLRGLGELRRRLLADPESMVDQTQGVGNVTDDGV